MGVAKSIEERLEGLVEGFFTKVFRSGLQPVEVGRRILKDMAAGKTVSVNRIYAPNEFTVTMSSDDHGRFSQMAAGLQAEFSELVIEQAKQNRWNLMGLPRVTFHAAPSMGKGEFRVEAALTADEGAAALDLSGADTSSKPTPGGDEGPPVELLVIDDAGDPTERLPVPGSPAVIGRMSTNDIVVSDVNVSRRHAELRAAGGRWTIVDLGSTNGTLVNGKVTKEHLLTDGDRLTLGSTELVFRLKKS